MEGRGEKYGSKLIKRVALSFSFHQAEEGCLVLIPLVELPVLGGRGWQLNGVRLLRLEIPNYLCFRYHFTSGTFAGLTEVEGKSLPNVLLNSGFTNRLHFFVGEFYFYFKVERNGGNTPATQNRKFVCDLIMYCLLGFILGFGM